MASLRTVLDEQLRCVSNMAQPDRRLAAARAVAAHAGAEDLIVFVRDDGVDRSLPALGFPQTLREGRTWRDLLERAVAGAAEGTVTMPDGTSVSARALGNADGTVAVLLGGAPRDENVVVLVSLLPLLGVLFRSEKIARHADAVATLARQSAAQSSELAAKLDHTRADLQRALTVAETATRTRDEFLATVSHELRTPLTSIIGWMQLLRDEKDPRLFNEGLDTVDRNARAQSRLIEDILDYSRINAGKLRLDVRAVDVADVVNEALAVVRPAADAKGLRIDSVLDPNSGVVSGDPDRIQQIMWNLLSNAVKFTSRGGRVQVRLERVNSHVELTVSDTGEGVSPEFLPYVFDRFSQADSTSTRVHSGLGLGLGIVRHLVELHGGTVKAFSPGVGKGATFAVRLPVLVAHEHAGDGFEDRADAAPVSSPQRDHFADLRGVSILVVEDNDDSRKLLTTIFNRCGADVEAADNATAALEQFTARRPDVLISDIEMPGEDGYSLIRRIREQESPGDRTPAIALTAYTRNVDRVRALAAGFQTHMAKPVDPAELVATIKSLLSTTHRLPDVADR